MSTFAETQAAEARRHRRSRPVPRARRRPVAGGVLWIVLIAVLLAGIVAVNVVVLQLNVQLDRLSRERVGLIADNARLESSLSTAGASARIESDARDELGLVPADAATTTYVDLASR
jgi:cell division protein FtsL